MRRLGILIWSIVVLLVVGVSASVAAASSAHGPDRSIEEWPNWSGRVACDGGLPFNPLVTFLRPTDAERGSSLLRKHCVNRLPGRPDMKTERPRGRMAGDF
jgi:hypothetical protein